MSRVRWLCAALVLTALALLAAMSPIASAAAPCANLGGLEDDGCAAWHLAQPLPPPQAPGLGSPSVPIGLGPIGDIEFWAPNRGLLITAGNGSTIPPGVWVYDGESWHELANVCGATDGRIAWEGPDAFWTISNGRPGQAANPANGEPAPLADDTLCHFVGGQVLASYAAPAFQANSYQPMSAAACFGPQDCWFGGGPLPEPLIGAFQLHWNGSALNAEPNPQGHAVGDMRLFGNHLYESVRIAPGDLLTEPESPLAPPVLHRIAPAGVQPTFISLQPSSAAGGPIPEYTAGEFPGALDFLHLSADAQALWGAAGPAAEVPEGSASGEVTVVRYANGVWSQVLGAGANPPSGSPFAGDVVEGIAAEPGSESAWVALDTQSDAAQPSPLADAIVARVSANGTVSDVQTLPLPGEGVAAKGAAARIACPAPHECWLTTTQGWLFHLAPPGSSQPLDSDPDLVGPITFRPEDEGLPQVPPDAPPVDDSGLIEEPLFTAPEAGIPTALPEALVTLPLLSGMHTRVLHRTTLELRFKLAVKARVRLIAKRARRVVARTALRTLRAGEQRLLLRLDPQRWPTKLALQTHALAPLPTVKATSQAGANTNSVTTESLAFPNMLGLPRAERWLAGSAFGTPGSVASP
ncbi:MAG TPA: hypothetical protein VK765_03055 [Solirubrobacteraceae bacterium]|jgi:hypothetical protein|nr:hypothetical protein [Solirubrobacteraceae bacterium]